MCIFSMKFFLVITVFLAHNKSGVCVSSGPNVRIQNGSIVRNLEKINIPHGEPLEIFCTGQAEKLKITLHDEIVSTTVVNETTIKHFEEKPKRGDARYSCIDIKDPTSEVVFFVSIGMLPETRNFSCTSKNLEYIICTWTSSDIRCKFNLFYIKDGKKDSHWTPTCRVFIGSLQSSFECVWDIKNRFKSHDFDSETLAFVMEACNSRGCSNQTFEIHHRAIIKLNPPTLLRILRKGSHTAVLQWTGPKFLPVSDLHIDHRISYWYSGIQPVQVDTSSLVESAGKYVIELKLPCARTYYEIRVSVRPKEAVKEEYWSDDAVIYFMTDSESNKASDEAGVVCGGVFGEYYYDEIDEPSMTYISESETPNLWLYEIATFKIKVKEEHYELKKRISSLKTRRFCKINQPLL